MAMSKIKAVFFDAGETLIHAHPSVPQIYSDITKGFGVNVTPQLFKEHFIPVVKEFMGNLYTRPVSSDRSEKNLWKEITHAMYLQIPILRNSLEFLPWFETLFYVFGTKEAWRVFDDVHSTLKEIKSRKLKCGIISNWDTRLENILKGYELDSYMDFIAISAKVGYRKPDARIFEYGLTRMNLKPDQVIYVGDSYVVDVLGAKQIGINSLLIDRNKENTEVNGTKVIHSLGEILNEISKTDSN